MKNQTYSCSTSQRTIDVDAKDELKRALQEYKGSILMVCHEPEFLYRRISDRHLGLLKIRIKIKFFTFREES